MSAETRPFDRKQLKSLRVAAIGNALEWFDWTLYGMFSVYLSMNLFNKEDPTSALLSTLLAFAGGFIARPIGGWVFGRFGDVYGRKNAMVITMCLVALGSLGIAILPTYDSVGAWASVLLFMLRLLQGLAHGGETGVSFTYVAEIAPAKSRGFWSSAVYISVLTGVIAATGVAALLTSVLSAEAMNEWGWRIGFALGGVLGLYALILRRGASESHAFEKAQAAGAVAERPRMTGHQIWIIARNIVMISAVVNAAYYTWVTFAASNAISQGMDPSGAYRATLLAQIICLGWLPVAGWLADKVGRRAMVMAFGLGVVIISFPVSWMVTDAPWTLFVAQLICLFVWGILAGMYPALVSEQVPTHARATSVGWITSTAAAIFGGTAPYLYAWLNAHDAGWVYNAYLVVLGLISAFGGYLIKETAGKPIEEIGVTKDTAAAIRAMPAVSGVAR